MKKFRKYFICLLVVFCLFSICVYAEMNLGVEYVNKYDDVYDVDVLVNDNFRLDSKNLEVISLPDDFKMFNTCEGLDGSILTDCDQTTKKTIGYIYPEELTVSSVDGELQQIPGEISLKFNKAATLKDGTYADIIMNINNIKIKRNREDIKFNKPVVVLRQGPKYISNEANSGDGGFSVNYDITFKLAKNGSIVENLTIGIIFSDIDVYNTNHPDYSESIELLSGIEDNKVYRLTGSKDYLCINENNTKFTSAKVCGLTTEEKWNFTDEEEKLKGGFALKVKSDRFEYNWTGSGCGTDISFITVNDVEPEVPVVEPEPDIPDDNPKTGNISIIVMVMVLLIASGVFMFIFLRKNNKFN